MSDDSFYRLLIYCPVFNFRVHYTFNLVFKNFFGLNYILTNDKEEYIQSQQPKINYSNLDLDGITIRPYGLLSEKGIKPHVINCFEWEGVKVFFKTESDISFDIFSATFFLLTRYEEYLKFTPDKHGRFKADQSVAYKNDFLQFPVIDIWMKKFGHFLVSRYPHLQLAPRNFSHIVTIDIDQAFLYKSKGYIRNSGYFFSNILRFNFKGVSEMLRSSLNMAVDPFETFDYINSTCKKYSINPLYFILSGKNSLYDRNIILSKPPMQQLVRKLSLESKIGLHPSYRSNKSYDILAKEHNALSELVQKAVEISRQHYLKLSFPRTYKNLVKLGIVDEFSMGYSEIDGFRAGTCTPYIFYDLSTEKTTWLKVYPLVISDNSYKYYQKLSLSDTRERMLGLLNEVKEVGGTMVSLWHNETFKNDVEGNEWRKIFELLLERSAV